MRSVFYYGTQWPALFTQKTAAKMIT